MGLKLTRLVDQDVIPTKVSQLENDAKYQNEEQVDTKIQQNKQTKESLGLGNVDNTSDLNKPISLATQSVLELKANKVDIPTRTSQLTNDSNYLTQHQSLDNYYSKSEIEEKLDTKENKANLKALAYKDALTKADVGLSNVNNVTITQEQVTQIGTNKTNIENLGVRVSTNETNIANAQSTSNEALSIAKGRARTKVFETYNELATYLKSASATEFNVGDNLLIRELYVPDYWISKVLDNNSGTYGYYEINILETTKVDLSNYYDKSEIDTKETNLNNKINEKADLSVVYTKSQVDSAFTSRDENIALLEQNKANKSDVPTKISQLQNDEGYLKEHQSLANYYTKIEVYNKTESDNKYQVKGDYALKSELPKNISELNDDVGLITEEDLINFNPNIDLTNYYKKSEVNELLNEKSNVGDSYTKTQSDEKYQEKGDYAYKNEIPTTLPASDVYSWAKQPSKPTYTKVEIGLGNVNNIAITQEQVSQIDTNKTNIENTNKQVATNIQHISNAQSTATEALNIAKGRAKTIVFDTFGDMTNYLKSASKDEFKLGDNLLIKATSVPDYWISNILDSNSGVYGYYEISVLETTKVDLSNYYNKSEVDTKETNINNKINAKANTSDVYNKTEIDTKEQALNDKIDVKANKTEIPTKVSQLTNDKGYLTEHQSLENYYTKTQVYNKTESDNKYQAQGNYALKSELFSKNYNDLTNKPTIPTKTSQLTNDSNFLTEHQDISGKADKSEIPTKVSELINDSGYLTSHQSLANYYNKSEVDTKLNAKENKANLKALAYKDSLSKSDVGLGNVTNEAQIPLSQKGANGGVATLGSDGKVPSSQLPSYVDDVLEYTSKSLFPTSGETGKIYVDTTTNITYRWSGTTYVEISSSLALGETSSTAYSGDKGKANAQAISNLQSNKANKSDIPTKVSQLSNDSGFLTQHQDISHKANTSDVYTKTQADNKFQLQGNYVTTDTTQTISGTKTYTGNNIFKNNNFEIKAGSANDDSWIKLTNATDSGYYAFGIRRPYASYGLQMKYHPASGNDEYYNIWHAGNFTPSNYLTTSVASSTYQPKGDYLTSITKSMVTTALGYTPPTTNTTYSAGTGLSLSGTSFSVKYGTTSGTACSGNDSRLSDSRNAKDVYDWAKASAKPTYTWSEITSKPDTFTPPTATSSTLGGVKVGSNISVSSGTISLTKDNVTSALGYTPPTTNTTYSNATTSADGLMSSSDKSKLDGIEKGANNFSLPARLATVGGSGTGYADPNSAIEQGWHYITQKSTTRPPFKQVDGATGDDYRVMTTAYGSTWLQQIATDYRSNDIFTRRLQNGTWQGWTALVKMQQGLASPIGTNNAIARWDSSRNATIKDSKVTIDDNGVLNAPTLKENGTTLSDKYQAKVSALGSTMKPVYISSAGTFSETLQYAGGTSVTLNGTLYASKDIHIYAPSLSGKSGQVLTSSGVLQEPIWKSLKTINGQEILGSGNIEISGGSSGGMVKVFEGCETVDNILNTNILMDGYRFYLMKIYDNASDKYGYLFAFLNCYTDSDIVMTGFLSEGNKQTVEKVEIYWSERGDVESSSHNTGEIDIEEIYRIG